MQVSASIRQSWGLNHYGEFDSFERADKHLTGEGWKCEKRIYNGVAWRWEYVKGAEILVLKEVED